MELQVLERVLLGTLDQAIAHTTRVVRVMPANIVLRLRLTPALMARKNRHDVSFRETGGASAPGTVQCVVPNR